jgi:hypothetical protein
VTFKLLISMIACATTTSVAFAQQVPVPGQWYRLQVKHSQKYLDVSWGSTDEHAPVVQLDLSPWSNGGAQLWTLVPEANGLYRIQVKHSSKYLEVAWGSTADHAKVGQADRSDWSGGAAQLWRLIPVSDGWYRLQVEHSQKYLDVEWGSTDDRAAVVQSDLSEWNGGAAQLWRFVPPASSPAVTPQPPALIYSPHKYGPLTIHSLVGQGTSPNSGRVTLVLSVRAEVVVRVAPKGSQKFVDYPPVQTGKVRNGFEYRADIPNLKPGVYEFVVSVRDSKGVVHEERGTFGTTVYL